MVNSLGGVNVTPEGKVTVSPTTLGVDPQDVANQVRAAKEKTKINPVKDSIDLMNKKQVALSSLQTKTQTLQASLARLRGPQDGMSAPGIFAKNQAALSSDSYIDPNSLVGVVMTDAAKQGSFTLKVNRLAMQDTLVSASGAGVGATNTALGLQGTLTLGVAGGTSQTLNVSSTWTLQDLVSNINTQTGTTKVIASTVSVGPNDVRLSLQTVDTGKPLVIDNRLSQQTNGVGAVPDKLVPTAKTDALVATTGISDPTAPLNWGGALTLALGAGTSATLNADANWSVTDWVTQINQNTATSGVSASLVREGLNDYRIALRSTTPAATISITNNLTAGGSVDPATALPTTAQVPATLSAEVVYQGVTAYRDSNKITDLYKGMTIALQRKDPATTVTVEVEPDRNGIAAAVDDFIDAWNDLTKEIKSHEAMKDDGSGKADTALLFNDDILTTVKDAMQQTMSGNVGGLSASNLRSFGLTLKWDGTIVKDVDNNGNPLTRLVAGEEVPVTVADSINNRLDEFQKLWAFNATNTNTKFIMDGHPAKLSTGISQNPVTVTLSKDSGGTLTATFSRSGGATVNAVVTPLGAGNIVRIASAPGDTSEYAGFSFTYVGALVNGATDTTQLTMTQGLGNILDLQLQKMLDSDPDVGSFAKKVDEYSKQIKDKQEFMLRLTEQLDKERQRLLDSFGSLNDLMAKLAPVNSILKAFSEKAAAAQG